MNDRISESIILLSPFRFKILFPQKLELNPIKDYLFRQIYKQKTFSFPTDYSLTSFSRTSNFSGFFTRLLSNWSILFLASSISIDDYVII